VCCDGNGFGDQEGAAVPLHQARKSEYELKLEKEKGALLARIAEMEMQMKSKDLKPGGGQAETLGTATAPIVSSDVSGGSKFKSALAIAEAAVKDLDEYYNKDKHVLKDAVVRPGGKSEAVLVAKMALAMLEDEGSFKIAALGSSVTAGHDTFVSAAWPAVIERALKPTWDALGVDFVVRNQAVGGRDPNPWPFCMPQMAGDDVDIIIREWEYWPFAAGFDESEGVFTKKGSDPAVAAIEVFIRMALLTQKQPAVHFLKMSHERAGGASNWFLNWFSADGKLSQYSDFALQAFDSFGRPFDKLRKLTPDSERLDNDFQDPQKCPPDQLANVANCPVDAAKPDGFHTRARHLGFNETEHPQWKDMVDYMVSRLQVSV
jgi:hypothetical protein